MISNVFSNLTDSVTLQSPHSDNLEMSWRTGGSCLSPEPAAGHTRNSDQRMGLEFTKHHKHCSPSSPVVQTTQDVLNVSTTKTVSTRPFSPFLLKTLKILEKYFLPSFWFWASFCFSSQHATEANIPLPPNEIHFFFWGFTAGIKCFTQQQMGVS